MWPLHRIWSPCAILNCPCVWAFEVLHHRIHKIRTTYRDLGCLQLHDTLPCKQLTFNSTQKFLWWKKGNNAKTFVVRIYAGVFIEKSCWNSTKLFCCKRQVFKLTDFEAENTFWRGAIIQTDVDLAFLPNQATFCVRNHYLLQHTHRASIWVVLILKRSSSKKVEAPTLLACGD